MASDDEFVTVQTFHDTVQAELARTKFESEGLEVQLRYGALTNVYPTPSGGIGGTQLLVPRDQLGFAERLLAEFNARAAEEVSLDEDAHDSAFSTDEGDAWMRRAAAGAVLGLFMCPPVFLYAVWVLAVHLQEPRSAKGNWMLAVALAFVGMGAGLWGIGAWLAATAP